MRSGKKKYTLGLVPSVLTILALLIAACGGTGGGTSTPTTNKPTKGPASQQVLRLGDPISDFATLDPGQATDLPSIQAIDMIFTGLVEQNDQLQVIPQLAQNYSSSADGLTWTFTLRQGLKFSDGTPLTSADVAYSIDRALSPAVANLNGVTLTYLGLLKDASKRAGGKVTTLIGDSILTPDANTVQLIVSQKTAYFLEALTYPTAWVVEKKILDQWGLTKWTDHLADNGGQGGDGPFKVLSYSHTTGIDFVPNPNYYGAAPQLQKVSFLFYKDAETEYKAYQANQIDDTAIPPEDLPQARLLTKEYSQNSELVIDYLAMNYLYKPFDNIHIRQAFEMAINRDLLSSSLYHNLRVPTCHIVPSGMPGYDANLKCPGGQPTSGNATMAKQLFDQGLQEEGLTLATFPPVKITYESNAATLDNEITTIRQMWQNALGITVTTQVLDFVSLLTAVTNTLCTQTDVSKCANKGLQMWALAWGADYPDPQDWLTLQFDKNAPNNDWNYGQNLCTCAATQQAVQTTLEQADATLDNSRLALYNQSEQSLVNDVAWLSLFQRNGARLRKAYVVGIVDNAESEVPPDDWGQVYIAAH